LLTQQLLWAVGKQITNLIMLKMLITWTVNYIAVYDDTPALYLTPELKCFIYKMTSQKWWTPQGYVFFS